MDYFTQQLRDQMNARFDALEERVAAIVRLGGGEHGEEKLAEVIAELRAEKQAALEEAANPKIVAAEPAEAEQPVDGTKKADDGQQPPVA